MTDFRFADRAADIEARLRQNRLMDLPVAWQDEIIFPAYEGLSLRNIPHSIAELLGVTVDGQVPLDDVVWGDEKPADIQRVVLFLMDGTGYLHLQRLMAEDDDIRQAIHDLTDGRGIVPLTSVAPSTTAVALTTLWTGGTPGQTGLLGTAMYLRELSMLCDVLFFKPLVGKHAYGSLQDWGLDAPTFVPLSGMGEHLATHGIPTYLVTDQALSGTGLSKILHRGVAHSHAHISYSDMPLRLREIMQQTAGERAYISAYWPAVDSLAHVYGAFNDYTAAEVKKQVLMLRDTLADESVQDGQTLFMLIADHGHHDAPHDIDLMNDAAMQPFKEAMMTGLSGDGRLGYVHLRDGYRQQAIDVLNEHYADRLAWMSSAEAREAGFFGPAPFAPDVDRRSGDLILIPRRDYVLRDPSVAHLPLVSWHAGLDAYEMLIPFVWRVI